MVRVLFVRHGFTEGNLRDARMAIRVARREVPAERAAPELMRAAVAAGGGEASGDTRLSAAPGGGGLLEARLLARYWSRVLRSKADAGELHVFVSAMQRCLQTADGLVRALGVGATVDPELMEVPGLCAPADRVWLDEQVRPRVERGELAAARALLAARGWGRCGLTAAEVRAAYPWSRVLLRFPADPGERWHPGMWELPAETAARIEGRLRWLRRLARELPPAHVVVVVAHGDTIWRLLAGLLGIAAGDVGHQLANTSVSSLAIAPNGAVQMDFLNRTPHLVPAGGHGRQDRGEDRNDGFYQYMGLMARPVKPGRPRAAAGPMMLDLGGRQKDNAAAFKAFLAKL